jgi:hypothetical protein
VSSHPFSLKVYTLITATHLWCSRISVSQRRKYNYQSIHSEDLIQLMEILGSQHDLSQYFFSLMRPHCVDAASTSLDRGNIPIVDREALFKKAVLAALENRITPSWNQLIPNLDHIAAGLVGRQEQVAQSNGHATDLSIETQYLLSRLAAAALPEALALLLQSGGQLSTTPGHALGSHPLVHERAGPVPLTHASPSSPDPVRMQACPSQRQFGHSSSLHDPSVLPPMRDKPAVPLELVPQSTDSSLARPVAEQPMQNSELSAVQENRVPPAPLMQRLFPQQSTAHHLTAAIGRDARATGSSFRPIPAVPRPAMQPPIVQLSDSSQSGSDEQLPAHPFANMEVKLVLAAVLFVCRCCIRL